LQAILSLWPLYRLPLWRYFLAVFLASSVSDGYHEGLIRQDGRLFNHDAEKRREKMRPQSLHRTMPIAILVLALCPLLCMPVLGDMATMYNITDLQTLPGAVSSTAADINGEGQIVGWSVFSDGHERAYLWRNGTMTDLGTLPGRSNSRAYAINDFTQIVGEAWTVDNVDTRGVLYDSAGTGQNTNLGTLGGPASRAMAINNAGQIVGQSKKAGSSDFFATSFDPTGNQVNLAVGPAGSDAQGINDHGVATGGALMPGGYHAITLDMTGGSNYTDLGSLGGWDNGTRAMNDLGQVVGEAQAPSRPIVAAIFDFTTGIATLGTLGGRESMAGAINNLGEIVGWADTITGQRHATLFDSTGNGNNVDLNTLINPALGWTLTSAWGITDKGWIVGSGISPDGNQHGYLLTPVPVPGAALLGVLGLTFAGWRLRRKTS
jgi:probable HAF family extracellular repeat protein